MLRALAFVLLLTASCGGRSALDDWPTTTSSAHDATTPADASKPGRDATLQTVDAAKPDAAVDAMACVDITLSAADLVCATDPDCATGRSGEFCLPECWSCESRYTPMNAGAAARYQAELDSLGRVACGPCAQIFVAPVECVGGKCVGCPRGADGSAMCGDGGSPRPRDAGGDAIPDASVISLDAAGELDAATPVDDAGSCASPVVTFQLTARPGSTWFISGSDNSDTPGSTWLTLFLPSGVQLFTSAGETLSLDCRSCSGMFPYGFGYWMSELPDAGVTGTWNGFAYVAGACGSSGTACLTPLCMPRGPYLAKMCATHEDAAAGPTCVDVPFEYPTTQTITGMLP
jgi:hypothetical protein